MRLNKWLVEQGIAPARRKADQLIAEGRVRVGATIASLGQDIGEDAQVFIDGKRIELVSGQEKRLIAYHKPVGQVCSHMQQGSAETIFAHLPDKFAQYKIVGRLDKDSEGLVLLTNDGHLAHEMSHPSREKDKRYEVTVNRSLTEGEIGRLQIGVTVDGDAWRLDTVREIRDRCFEIILHEGKNRHIRRCLEAVGVRVIRLVRTDIDSYALGTLQAGAWREETISG